MSTAKALATGAAVVARGTVPERRGFAESLAEAAFRAGGEVSLRCLLALMRLGGIKAAWACGCRIGTFGKTYCERHGRAKRRHEKRVQQHRTCPCGYKDRAAALCAELHAKAARAEKDGYLESAKEYRLEIAENRADRAAHRCEAA